MRHGIALTALLLLSLVVHADDWPHWMGLRSDGTSAEKGLATTWPQTGPKVLWKKAGGDGYSAIAVSGDRAITMVQRDGKELVVALDVGSGKNLWSTPMGPAFKNANGSGPRATPWIEGDRVYVQSVSGPVACLDAKNGKVLWQKNLLTEFGAKNIAWGLSASPVIAGDLLLVIPGAKNAGVAALDKRTGAVVWKTGSDKAAYASPVVADVGGQKQAIFFTAAGLLGVTLDKGAELWRIAWPAEFDCNIATPLLLPGNKLFVSSGEGNGCGASGTAPVRFAEDGVGVEGEEERHDLLLGDADRPRGIPLRIRRRVRQADRPARRRPRGRKGEVEQGGLRQGRDCCTPTANSSRRRRPATWCSFGRRRRRTRNGCASSCWAATGRCRRCRGGGCSCGIWRTFCVWMSARDVPIG